VSTSKRAFKTVDDYIGSHAPLVRRLLEQVRRTIRKALPDADEVIAYNMPTYKLHGDTVLHFAGWKEHYSLYAATEPVLAAFGNELRRYTIEKGTIRFPLSEPVPEKLIEGIAQLRFKEIAERRKS
jgi:uncharacterized protein YdhG (YjbR/CyaY superfamily)